MKTAEQLVIDYEVQVERTRKLISETAHPQRIKFWQSIVDDCLIIKSLKTGKANLADAEHNLRLLRVT